MKNIKEINSLFNRCIADYHAYDHVDQPIKNPYEQDSLEYLLYWKNWVDTVQWHLEDIIREPSIDPAMALKIKRRIDHSNQERTDLVEKIDDVFLENFKATKFKQEAKLNTESPAWALDRLSILALKIFHMEEQVNRKDVGDAHLLNCRQKLEILIIQKKDLMQAIEELLEDIANGNRIMKVYRQMKMYNDPSLNPVLYGNKKV